MLIFKNNIVLKIKVNYAGLVLNKIQRYKKLFGYNHNIGSSAQKISAEDLQIYPKQVAPTIQKLNYIRKLPSEVVDKVRQKLKSHHFLFSQEFPCRTACLETWTRWMEGLILMRHPNKFCILLFQEFRTWWTSIKGLAFLSILIGESNVLVEPRFYIYIHNVMVVDLGDREIPSC